jgi:putative SOS response-associated peptidase YedK
MCAQFLLKAQAKDLAETFGITLDCPDELLNQQVLPHKSSLTVTAKGFRVMNFSLTPSWSKEKRTKFATHNARLETLATKPTWRVPFETKRCVVPLTTFVEPAYENEFAGNMVGFHTPKNDVLYAAGIYDEWVDHSTGEVFESYAIITTEPYEIVQKIGHQRSPLFLREDKLKEWMDPTPKKSSLLLQFLKLASAIPELQAEKQRPMKAGWEKRKPKD